jgi:endogenous inhibitor of DNA gyrase (YacG/DUF329 family)
MKCRREACQNEVEQAPGSHRQRAYCSDRCRVNDFKEKKRAAELEKARLEELARQRAKWDRLSGTHYELLPEQIEVLYDYELSVPKERVLRAFRDLQEYASASYEERKVILRAKLLLLGEDLGYPAVAVGRQLAAGAEHWNDQPKRFTEEELLEIYREVFWLHRLYRLEQERKEQARKAEEERLRWTAYYAGSR